MATRSSSPTPRPLEAVPGLFLVEAGYADRYLCTAQLRFENETYRDAFVASLEREPLIAPAGYTISVASFETFETEEGCFCNLTLEGSGDRIVLGSVLSARFSIDEMLKGAGLLPTGDEKPEVSESTFGVSLFDLLSALSAFGNAAAMGNQGTPPSPSDDTWQNTVAIDDKEYVMVDYPGESNACLPLALILTPLLERVRTPDAFFSLAEDFFGNNETSDRVPMLKGIEYILYPLLGLLRTGKRSELSESVQAFLGFLGSTLFLHNRGLKQKEGEINPEKSGEPVVGEQQGQSLIAAAAEVFEYRCDVYKKNQRGELELLAKHEGNRSSEIEFKIFHGHYDHLDLPERVGGENHYFALVDKSKLGFSSAQRQNLPEILKNLWEKANEAHQSLERSKEIALSQDLKDRIKQIWSGYPGVYKTIVEEIRRSLEKEIWMLKAFEQIAEADLSTKEISQEVMAWEEGHPIEKGSLIKRLYDVCSSFVEEGRSVSDDNGNLYMIENALKDFKNKVRACVENYEPRSEAKTSVGESEPEVKEESSFDEAWHNRILSERTELPVDDGGEGCVIVERYRLNSKQFGISIGGYVSGELIPDPISKFQGTPEQLRSIEEKEMIEKKVKEVSQRVLFYLNRKARDQTSNPIPDREAKDSESKPVEPVLTEDQEEILVEMTGGNSIRLQDLKGSVLDRMREEMGFEDAVVEFLDQLSSQLSGSPQSGINCSSSFFPEGDGGAVSSDDHVRDVEEATDPHSAKFQQ